MNQTIVARTVVDYIYFKKEKLFMPKKNYDELAKSILELVGSSDNVSETYHCMTRLRFNLKDKGQVNIDGIKELAEVVGAQWSGDQLQIIIG